MWTPTSSRPRAGSCAARSAAGRCCVYVFLFAPIVAARAVQLQRQPYGDVPDHRLDDQVVRGRLRRLPDPGRVWTSLDGRARRSRSSARRRHGRGVPARALAPAFRSGIRIAMTLPIMIPGLLIGVSLLVLFTTSSTSQLSPTTAVIGQSVYTTPFVLLLVARAAAGLRPGARAGGERPRREHVQPAALRRASRCSLPAILAGALLAFTLSLRRVHHHAVPDRRRQTLPIYIYTQVKFGITPR